MNSTPRAIRPHIVILGRCNVGKSTLINALCEQSVALVSEQPGTTTDPVFKSMELLPFGPVVVVDTAGLDDQSALGQERVKLTERALRKADIALLVVDRPDPTPLEQALIARLEKGRLQTLIVINDRGEAPRATPEGMCVVNALTGHGVRDLKERLASLLTAFYEEQPLVRDLLTGTAPVILVTPIDKAAPKGRLILPQVQVLRDIIDGGFTALVCRETELTHGLTQLAVKPQMVITDSQVFKTVASIIPEDIPLTSFSILMARHKGDLAEFVQGIEAIPRLKPHDDVLIVEACTHHSQEDDIGRVKIPRLLENKVGGRLTFTWCSGPNFLANLSQFKLVIHCGACMFNRKEMLARLDDVRKAGIPMVNYGMLLAYMHGILERSLKPVASYE
ncbi:MAG: [FeFe] hydrogenase H-cluster maturation GTPase HydF [Peptococcaceae bacterium]|nr:[FeFe] hydrogenase H-cluster maturation GTPase HydF [Peptococcaceae bacterium]